MNTPAVSVAPHATRIPSPGPSRPAPGQQEVKMSVEHILGVARQCDERAATYGALRASALTAIVLDRAAETLRAIVAGSQRPSAPTLHSELNKDRSGKHGTEVA